MTVAVNKDLIDLQNAHVSQFTTNGTDKTEWLIRQNITSKDLATLPAHMSESDVFTVLDFAREFELKAFNIGIKYGKDKTVKVYEELVTKLNEKLEQARDENERLATILEKHIGE